MKFCCLKKISSALDISTKFTWYESNTEKIAIAIDAYIDRVKDISNAAKLGLRGLDSHFGAQYMEELERAVPFWTTTSDVLSGRDAMDGQKTISSPKKSSPIVYLITFDECLAKLWPIDPSRPGFLNLQVSCNEIGYSKRHYDHQHWPWLQ